MRQEEQSPGIESCVYFSMCQLHLVFIALIISRAARSHCLTIHVNMGRYKLLAELTCMSVCLGRVEVIKIHPDEDMNIRFPFIAIHPIIVGIFQCGSTSIFIHKVTGDFS